MRLQPAQADARKLWEEKWMWAYMAAHLLLRTPVELGFRIKG